MTKPDICQMAARPSAPMTERGSAVRPGRRMLMRRSSRTLQTGWRQARLEKGRPDVVDDGALDEHVEPVGGVEDPGPDRAR